MIRWCLTGYVLSCDICGSPDVEEKFNSFQDAVDYKKINLWLSQKRGGQWEDVCPECDMDD